MALETAFHILRLRSEHLLEAFEALRTTIVEDRPLKVELAFVDTLGEMAEDLVGRVQEIIQAAQQAEKAVGPPVHVDLARRALSACQSRYNQLAGRFNEGVCSYDSLASLMRMGRQHAGECRAWTVAVRSAIEECRYPVQRVGDAMFEGWKEITERVGMTSVVAQASATGQRIQMLEPEN